MAKSININLQNTTQKRFINMNATADIKCYAVAAPCNLMVSREVLFAFLSIIVIQILNLFVLIYITQAKLFKQNLLRHQMFHF